jgi:ABC-2 type transport system permease protein
MGKAITFFSTQGGLPPINSLLDFFLAASVTHGVLFGGISAGADTAVDIENGFFDRLLASPVGRSNLLIGRLAGAAALGAIQATVFTGLFIAFGATVKGGVAAFVVLLLYAMLLALFVGGFAAALALRTGSAEAVQNFFPLTFILMFVSSAFFPTGLMKGTYRTVAERSPITWMIDGVRHQIISGFDLAEAAKALGVCAILAACTIALATRALQHRVAMR